MMAEHLSIVDASETTFPSLHILLEQDAQGNAIASVLELPDCKAISETREQALEELKEKVTVRLRESEILSLEVQPAAAQEIEQPWMKFAGIFKDDPHFDEYQRSIQND